MDKKLIDKLVKRELEGTKRSLSFFNDGIDFYSNDYLGIARDSNLESNHVYTGSTGSRLISGNSEEALKCEELLADFFEADKALVFNSGYDANIGFFSSVPQRGDTVLYDESIHASVRDGIRLSLAESFSFSHNSISDLEKRLQKAKGSIYVAIESLYSMEGDVAPLAEIVQLCKEYGAFLVVDEAHACGVFGEQGKGLVHHNNLNSAVFARIVTFGKAYGYHGACVLGEEPLIDYLINFARSFIYTTALPSSDYSAIQSVILKSRDEALRKKLHDNIQLFRLNCFNNNLQSSPDSPIQMVRVNNILECKKLARILLEEGFLVKPIFSPTVKVGQEGIRVCIHSYNTEDQILHLAELLSKSV